MTNPLPPAAFDTVEAYEQQAFTPQPAVYVKPTYRCSVFARFQFEAIHNWPNCPIESVSFLRDLHRHMFHVEAHAHVYHDDRDIEFIMMKRRLEAFIDETYPKNEQGHRVIGHTSCEMIARTIMERFDTIFKVQVSEDGENGCEMIRETH